AKGAAIRKISSQADHAIGAIDHEASMYYVAAEPLPDQAADRVLNIDLTGSMSPYRWNIEEISGMTHHDHLDVMPGERVEMVLTTRTAMSPPMHLHGHHFQVVAVDGVRVAGAVRDTELVPAKGAVTLAFEAGNPGAWMFHCHNLYHMLA